VPLNVQPIIWAWHAGRPRRLRSVEFQRWWYSK
jgi:hypothetical protein